MARLSLIQKNLKKELLINRYKEKRKRLKAKLKDKKLSIEERFNIQLYSGK